MKAYRIVDKHYRIRCRWYRIYEDGEGKGWYWFNLDEQGWQHTDGSKKDMFFKWAQKHQKTFETIEVSMLEVVVVAGWPQLKEVGKD